MQGDGITRHTLPSILKGSGFGGRSAGNVVSGFGGGLLQSCSRDALRSALKCNWVDVDGEVLERGTLDGVRAAVRVDARNA